MIFLVVGRFPWLPTLPYLLLCLWILGPSPFMGIVTFYGFSLSMFFSTRNIVQLFCCNSGLYQLMQRMCTFATTTVSIRLSLSPFSWQLAIALSWPSIATVTNQEPYLQTIMPFWHFVNTLVRFVVFSTAFVTCFCQ